jgi:hypothetical protein
VEWTQTLHHFTSYPLPLKKAKVDDLCKLVSSFVLAEHLEFFAELPYDEFSSDEDL